MVQTEGCSVRLLKHIVRCYHRLSEGGEAVRLRLQDHVRRMADNLLNQQFTAQLREDAQSAKWLMQFFFNCGFQEEALQLQIQIQAQESKGE